MVKKIHFSWNDGEDAMPDEYKELVADWREKLPDWTVKVWTLEEAKQKWPIVQQVWDIGERSFVKFSDMIRVLAVRDEGGLYTDVDSKLLDPERLIAACEKGSFLCEHIPPGQLNNCFFYFEPNHPFLQRISEIWSGFPPYVKRNGPIGGTGPGLFHKVRSNRPELTPEIYPVGEMLANWGAEGFPNAAVLHYNHGGWLRKSDVQVGAWTMILPRAEVDHFEEWLSYQKKLGIRHVWVYLDEDEVSDGQIGQKGGVEWDKKPEVDYHPEMTEDDVFRHLMEVADKVTGDDDETFEVHFRHVRHIDGYKERDSVGGRQELTVRDLVNNIRNQDEPHVDWLTLLDTDELIVVPEGLSQYLGKLPNNVASVKLKQKYFEGRWDPDGKPIPMAEIKENWGIVGFNVKHIIRPDKVVSCGSNRYPHCIHVVGQGRRSGQEVVPAWDRIRFHHFRGPVTVKFPNMFGLGAYDRVSKKPYKADDLGHAVYIDGSR